MLSKKNCLSVSGLYLVINFGIAQMTSEDESIAVCYTGKLGYEKSHCDNHSKLSASQDISTPSKALCLFWINLLGTDPHTAYHMIIDITHAPSCRRTNFAQSMKSLHIIHSLNNGNRRRDGRSGSVSVFQCWGFRFDPRPGWPSYRLKFTGLSILPGSVKWVPAYRGACICFRSGGGKSNHCKVSFSISI